MKWTWKIIVIMMVTNLCFLEECLCMTNGVGRLMLDTNWQFSMYGTQEWMNAIVPGTVHQDLLMHKKLPDPFYGMNEEKIQWVEKEDWLYRTSFMLSEEQLLHDEVVLVFEGLDTYADVFLNGARILQSDNMFVGHRVPVKSLLHKGENKLLVRFRSPIRETIPQWESNGFDYPADNDHFPQKLSVFTRKAPYSYGWDWGIRMVTCGIWRPVYLDFVDGLSFNDFFVCQQDVSARRADVINKLEFNSLYKDDKKVTVRISYSCGEQKGEVEDTFLLHPGVNLLELPLMIEQPYLWMPNGWGEPFLYLFEATAFIDGEQVVKKRHQIGLRKIRVVKEKDADGVCFYFEVNGIPLFVKGANLIPSDAMLPRVTAERYIRLLDDVQRSNMNMLRVWGGGIYEDDKFYDEADKRGILVWQDFLFACTTYPHDSSFLKRVSAEVEYNIKRLRNHASLAMWCGNNEIYEGIRYWGWKKRYTPEVYGKMEEGYNILFRTLLPELVERFDPGRFYLEGSPFEANWGRPDSWSIVDTHNWGIWHGRKRFETLDTEIPRFMSEFGFQSFPEMKTIRTFASPEDYALDSPVMNAHQKSSIGNALIRQTMSLYYKVPERFEDLVYVGLVLQGKGVRHGVEAHRRNRPYCMGTLPWQLNDTWPVVSWSSIDYYGNWKAMQYQLQRAFTPVLVNAVKEKEKLCYYVVSDCLESKDVELILTLTDFNGKVYRSRRVEGVLPANASVLFDEEDWEQAFQGCDKRFSYLRMIVRDKRKNEILSDEVYYPVFPKDQLLPDTEIHCKVKQLKPDTYEVVLEASQIARDVFIEVPLQGVRFTDNFFDLLPGEVKRVIIASSDGCPIENLNLKITHLGSIN